MNLVMMCSIFKLDPACVVVLFPYLLYEMILCGHFNGLGEDVYIFFAWTFVHASTSVFASLW